MSNQTIIHDLLVEYQRLNQQLLFKIQQEMGIPVSEIRKQVLEPPSSAVAAGIPTLDVARSQRSTEMMKARFAYAGSWKMADAGHEWLSLEQMELASHDQKLMQRAKDVITYWEGSPLQGVPFSRISFFGMHPDQGEEIYLLWPASGDAEPMVLSYVGNFETLYPNLEQYLRALIQGAKESQNRGSEK